MRRNVIRLVLCAMLFALGFPAQAQQPKKIPRIGYLNGASFSVTAARAEPAALALKLQLDVIEAQPDSKGLESAFQTAKQKQVSAIMTTATPPFFAERKGIVELAGRYRLPAIYCPLCRQDPQGNETG